MRRHDGVVSISSEDTQCWITCVCDERFPSKQEQFSISNYAIFRCPECGRGYRTEFVLWAYNPGEKDPVYLEQDEWEASMERKEIRFKEREK